METLANPDKTTLVLVAKPDNAPLAEAERASRELREIGVENQTLIINGVLSQYDDAVSQKLFEFQQSALETMPEALKQLEQSQIPLRAYNVTGVEKVRAFLTSEDAVFETVTNSVEDLMNMDHVIQDLLTTNKKVIFTMGKGGVGKTSIAAKIAHGLLEKGKKVHLTTTDPAAHLKWVTEERLGLTMSHIDEKAELEKYREEVLGKARCEMFEEDLAYIEEDLRSPCTQEIAVFRAFAEIVDKADHEVVVVDTAPTGHTLLLLDATQSYHREIQRSQGDIPESVKRLLPRLRDPQETEVVIVSLAEATPFYEAKRLEADLKRAGIYTNWWVINASLYAAETSNAFLRAKGGNELEWIRRIRDHASGSAAVIEWTPQVWRMNAADIS
jgi:arsenite-transporting ATPase